MSAKEKLIRDVLELDDERAARARIVIAEESEQLPVTCIGNVVITRGRL